MWSGDGEFNEMSEAVQSLSRSSQDATVPERLIERILDETSIGELNSLAKKIGKVRDADQTKMKKVVEAFERNKLCTDETLEFLGIFKTLPSPNAKESSGRLQSIPEAFPVGTERLPLEIWSTKWKDFSITLPHVSLEPLKSLEDSLISSLRDDYSNEEILAYAGKDLQTPQEENQRIEKLWRLQGGMSAQELQELWMEGETKEQYTSLCKALMHGEDSIKSTLPEEKGKKPKKNSLPRWLQPGLKPTKALLPLELTKPPLPDFDKFKKSQKDVIMQVQKDLSCWLNGLNDLRSSQSCLTEASREAERLPQNACFPIFQAGLQCYGKLKQAATACDNRVRDVQQSWGNKLRNFQSKVKLNLKNHVDRAPEYREKVKDIWSACKGPISYKRLDRWALAGKVLVRKGNRARKVSLADGTYYAKYLKRDEGLMGGEFIQCKNPNLEGGKTLILHVPGQHRENLQEELEKIGEKKKYVKLILKNGKLDGMGISSILPNAARNLDVSAQSPFPPTKVLRDVLGSPDDSSDLQSPQRNLPEAPFSEGTEHLHKSASINRPNQAFQGSRHAQEALPKPICRDANKRKMESIGKKILNKYAIKDVEINDENRGEAVRQLAKFPMRASINRRNKTFQEARHAQKVFLKPIYRGAPMKVLLALSRSGPAISPRSESAEIPPQEVDWEQIWIHDVKKVSINTRNQQFQESCHAQEVPGKTTYRGALYNPLSCTSLESPSSESEIGSHDFSDLELPQKESASDWFDALHVTEKVETPRFRREYTNDQRPIYRGQFRSFPLTDGKYRMQVKEVCESPKVPRPYVLLESTERSLRNRTFAINRDDLGNINLAKGACHILEKEGGMARLLSASRSRRSVALQR